MTQFDFGAFSVHSGNERAMRACRAVAEWRAVPAQPMVVYGERGSGKTHLLYATALHTRAARGRIGLFGITPAQFPDKVRDLVIDPTPIVPPNRAILLVDDLERIVEAPRDMESVVRAFLRHGQAVILCGSVHPDRMTNLTDGLRAIIAQGQVIQIARSPLASNASVPSGQALPQVAVDKNSIQKLSVALQRVKTWAASRSAVESQLRAQLEARRMENDALRSALSRADSARTMEALSTPAEALDSENEELTNTIRGLRDRLDGANLDAARAHDEVNTLLRRVDELQETVAAARGRIAQLDELCQTQCEELDFLRKQRQSNASEAAVAGGLARRLHEELEHVAAERKHMEMFLRNAFDEYTALSIRLEATETERTAFAATVERVNRSQEELKTRLDQALHDYDALQARMLAIQEGVSIDDGGIAAETDALRDYAAELERSIGSLESERDALNATVQQIREELAASRERSEPAHAGTAPLQAETETLLQTVQTERERFSRLEEDYELLAQRMEALQQQHEALQSEAADSRALIERLRGEIAGLREETATLQGRADEAATQRDEAVALLSDARAERDALVNEGASKIGRAELEAAMSGQDALRAELAALEDRMARDFEDARARWVEKQSELRVKCEQLEATNESLQSEKDLLAKSVAQLQEQLRTSRRQSGEAYGEIDKVVGRTEMLLAEIASERQRFNQLEEEHRRRLEAMEELQAENERVAAQAEGARASMRQVQATLDQAIADRDAARARASELEEERATLLAALDASRDTERALRAGIEKAQATVAKLQAAAEAVRARLDLPATSGAPDAGLKWLPLPAPAAQAAPLPAAWSAPAFETGKSRRRLGEILRESGYVTEEQLEDALTAQTQTRRKKLGKILVEHGFASDEAVSESVASQLGLPFARLHEVRVSPSAAKLCSPSLLKLHHCMPLRATEDELTLAMCEPLDLIAIDDVEREAQRRVKVVVAPRADIEEAQRLHCAA